MLSFLFLIFASCFLLTGALFGLLGSVLAHRSTVSGPSGFLWGAAFGLPGLIAVLFARSRRQRPHDGVANGAIDDQHELNHAARLACLGAVIAVLSLFLPWYQLGGPGSSRAVVPALDAPLRLSALIVSCGIILGAMLLLRGRTPVVLGLFTSTYTWVTLFFWLLGSRTSSILPKKLIPDNMTIRLSYGADIGVIAAVILLTSVFIYAFESTWSEPISVSSSWLVVSSILLSGLLLSAREASWINIETLGFDWRLTVDAIPLIGEAILLLLLVASTTTLVAGIFRRKGLYISSIASNSILIVVGILGWISREVFVNFTTWAARQFDGIDLDQAQISKSNGPIHVVVVALVANCVALISIQKNRTITTKGDEIVEPVGALQLEPEGPYC